MKRVRETRQLEEKSPTAKKCKSDEISKVGRNRPISTRINIFTYCYNCYSTLTNFLLYCG